MHATSVSVVIVAYCSATSLEFDVYSVSYPYVILVPASVPATCMHTFAQAHVCILAMKVLAVFACLFHLGASLDNGLGKTPQMGWNSWYHFYCTIDAQIVMDTADAMVT